MERIFTVDEASALLPELNDLLTRLQVAFRSAVAAGRATQRHIASSNGSATAALENASDPEHEVADILSEVEALGVIVRDAETGLVDFAGYRKHEAVYFCWRLGEERIGFWHPRDTGFMGRQPL
jgi:hypothetical protein